MREHYTFTVNGLEIAAEFDAAARKAIFLPLLERLTQLRRDKGCRITAFLAAPPGAGKSTLCCYLEKLSREYDRLEPVQCMGLDGFHLTNAELDRRTISIDGKLVPLRSVKGAPETFDVSALKACLEDAKSGAQRRWPVYDRRAHDPVPDAVEVRSDILIVEGNWLLLDEAPWNALECDYAIFLHAREEDLIERLVRRKMLGGMDEASARAFVRRSDAANIRRCLRCRRGADIELRCQNGIWEEISR